MARRRRSGARRWRAPVVVAVSLVLALLGLLVSGVIAGARGSTDHVQLVNRSFASQLNTAFEAQRVQGMRLEALLGTMPNLSRAALAAQLQALERQTASTAQLVERASSPNPSGDVGSLATGIVQKRATATAEIASAVGGLLGLVPPPITGAPASTATAAPAPLSASAAEAALASAGALLSEADRAVGPMRATLLRAPGRAYVIRSVFIADHGLLAASAMNGLVAALSGSTSLAEVHRLTISAYSVTPGALPTAAPPGTVNLPPTTTLGVSVTVSNLGNVAENHVSVTAMVTTPQGALLATATEVGAATDGGAVNLEFPGLAVSPGTQVVLSITLSPPVGQSGVATLHEEVGLVIAPSTPSVTSKP